MKRPWDVINNEPLIEMEDNNWIIKYLIDKGVPLSYLKKPEKEEQIVKIANYLFGSRNFILIVSQDSAYIKSLYYWLVAIWVTTTEKGFEICDPTMLNPFDQDYRETLQKLESASLLIMPYTDPTDYSLRKIKNTLGNILSKRKAAKKPTITDTFVPRIDKYETKDLVTVLSPVFGEQCLPMFLSDDFQNKIIKVGG